MENRKPLIVATGRASIFQTVDGHITISADSITVFGPLDDLDLRATDQTPVIRAPTNALKNGGAVVVPIQDFTEFPELVDEEYLKEQKGRCSNA
jgi:hypothetical protein